MTDVRLDTFAGLQTVVSHRTRRTPPCGEAYGFSGHQTDLAACAAAIRKGSKSFHLAAMILPRETRQAAQALYAFCRHADDLIDDARANQKALDQLHDRLDQIYLGRPAAYPCDRAFARTVKTYAIPKAVPLALLEGFAMDISNRCYRTIAEVKGYATCVASTVGLMMSLAMRTGDPNALARAADLGIAMQLTNIARDVGEDARNGRLYLPMDWLEDAGVDPENFLKSPRFSPALGTVVRRLLAEASRHYRLGHVGIEVLPPDCQPAIRTAALVYEEIGVAVAENGYDSVSHRARTGLTKKLSLMLRARRVTLGGPTCNTGLLDEAPDPATASLVSMAARSFAEAPRAAGVGRADPDRFLSIMMRLQSDARDDRRFRRLTAREKAASLV
ncbi:phytoene/squalene synthase family protein [Roseibium sp. FZY0029]|uniref:phytoene/squalene synthase family protein n=1 Tax=Roseibium sp. FZY0029 TaxID=3116647 RepID=UPI002E9DE1C8|nr:phytoene/squalene synthase family protein [Roseibium sp. FZY0029]